jgi:hypothetical protein
LSCFAAFAYVKKLFARDFYGFTGRLFISAEEHGDVRAVERPGGIKGFEGRKRYHYSAFHADRTRSRSSISVADEFLKRAGRIEHNCEIDHVFVALKKGPATWLNGQVKECRRPGVRK